MIQTGFLLDKMTNITKNYKNFTIHQFEELESTNKLAFQLASDGKLQENEIILATSQKQGRGRLNRNWISPPGNLYFSLVLKPQINLEKTHELSFIAICALRQTITEIAPNKNLQIKNKWPNDLLINDQKIAGILLESKISNNVEFCILGLGLNINSHPKNVNFAANNLQNLGFNKSKEEILEIFLDNFTKFYQNYQNFGFKNIRNFWLQQAYKLGEEIAVNLEEKKVEGVFKNIDESGNLEILAEGKLQKITTGDVS